MYEGRCGAALHLKRSLEVRMLVCALLVAMDGFLSESRSNFILIFHLSLIMHNPKEGLSLPSILVTWWAF